MRALAAALAALALAGGALAADRPNASDLEAELVCPTCKQTLDQSNAPVARRMKALIRQRIAEGATEGEIKAELVEQFGRGVLASPPKEGLDLLAWVLPLAGLGAGAAAVGLVAWRWTKRRGGGGGGDATPVDPELDRLVDAELARYEP